MTNSVNVHPSIVRTIAKTLASYNVDVDSLVSQAGLEPLASLTINSRVDGQSIDELWRLAVETTGDEALGLVFAQNFQLGILSGLGFCWAASDSLLDGFKRLSRFFKVIASAGELEIRETKDVTEVVLVLPVPYGVANDTGIDSSLALFMQLCRYVIDDSFTAKSVHYQRPSPVNTNSFSRFFNSKLVFDDDENKLVFDSKALLAPLPTANPDLARANDQAVIDYLRKHEDKNIVSDVSVLIIESLPSGTPSQQLVADKLHMSSKTLQRRLAASETSFTELLDDVRLNLAKTYLAQEWRSIGEICFLLGYTEPSNFGRWFKKLTGHTPIEFRSQA